MKVIAGVAFLHSSFRKLGLKAADYAVFAYALTHADAQGFCWPSARTIANALGISKNTVSDSIDRIEKAGVWRVVRRNRAASMLEIKPLFCWNCISLEPENRANCVHTDPEKKQTASNGCHEVREPSKSDSPRVARGFNGGGELEDEFWNWIASVPIMGKAMHDHRAIPATTKRKAKWLLNYAWNFNDEFIRACKAIDDWYSWPWTQGVDERKRSIGALIDNFTDQARLAEFYINQRNQFRNAK